MISQTAEYALRARPYRLDPATETVTAETIAAGTRLPVGDLARIMHGLTKAGLAGRRTVSMAASGCARPAWA